MTKQTKRITMTPAQKGAQTRKRNALLRAYWGKFGGFSGILTTAIYRAMAVALKTGNDHPVMIERRKENARNAAAYDARLAAEHAQPFTPELEKDFTAIIKDRLLIEGDCDRPWQSYCDYRAAHPKEVEPLNEADLAYAGQWTACALPKAAS